MMTQQTSSAANKMRQSFSSYGCVSKFKMPAGSLPRFQNSRPSDPSVSLDPSMILISISGVTTSFFVADVSAFKGHLP
jgi:hypothetical protein